MPLVAQNKQTGERIDITRYKNPRIEIPAASVVCPECQYPMVLKAGMIKIAHFAHKPGSNCSYGVGESADHLALKNYLIEWFRAETDEQFNVAVEPEYKIGNRRADVAQIFPTGWIVAHEVQLASITVEELEQRTRDYLTAGCDVIWYLGKSAFTPANCAWVERYQGQVLSWEFQDAPRYGYSGRTVKHFGGITERNGSESTDSLAVDVPIRAIRDVEASTRI